MSDATTEATRANDQVHREDLKTAVTAVIDHLTRLQLHARGPDKDKWARLQTKAHRFMNACDRVLTAT